MDTLSIVSIAAVPMKRVLRDHTAPGNNLMERWVRLTVVVHEGMMYFRAIRQNGAANAYSENRMGQG